MEQQLTFGEQVKIILSRKGMTIKELAEKVEAYTGKNMSRQNMTQRLGRDNFQEQDMRLIAEILGCKFQLSIMEPIEGAEPVDLPEIVAEPAKAPETVSETETVKEDALEREVTVGELDTGFQGFKGLRKGRVISKAETKELVSKEEPQPEPAKEPLGDINPYTGKEYASNSVRMHPKRIGYVQVYDQTEHKWTDMTEWAFLGFQERKKALLGKDYEPPTYLD